MQSDTAFLHLDWAMKWLPAARREDQSGWFGKRGIPWHITVAFTKIGGSGSKHHFEMHTFVHVFDQNPQDSDAVIAIIRDVLRRLNTGNRPIKKVYIRSDNAGCYHSSPTIAAIPQLSSATGVEVKRWDFSDPQAGTYLYISYQTSLDPIFILHNL